MTTPTNSPTPESKSTRGAGGRLAFLLVVVAIVAGMFIKYYVGW